MPRRKRVRTSRKKTFRTRSKGKLFSRRGRTFRRRYVRRGRRVRYGKSRKFIRRYRSSSKFPYMKLVKHSVFLSPSDFLLFPYHDLVNLLAAASYQGTGQGLGNLWISHPNDVLANSMQRYSITWVRDLIIYMRSVSMCHATKLIHPGMKTYQDISSSMANVRGICFNPPHSVVTGGAFFPLYINVYELFKFCGMKVKFIPHTSKGATTVPEYTGVIAQGQANETITMGYEPVTRWQTCIDIGKTDANLDLMMNDDDIKTVAPPQYRLWVNFDKNAAMSEYLTPWGLDGNMGQLNAYTQNGNVALVPDVWDKRCLQTRLKYVNMFKQGQLLPSLRSYSLTRPFKFYVRPYEIDTANESLVAPYAEEEKVKNDALKYIIEGPGDRYQKMPKRQGWIRMPSLYPAHSFAFNQSSFDVGLDWTAGDQATQASKSSQEMILNNLKLVANFADANYYNPPLFNYFFTRDDLDAQQGNNLLGIWQTPYVGDTLNFQKWTYEGYPNFNNAGKFKLTFYYRFKRPRPEVSFTLPNAQTKNANRAFNDYSVTSGVDAVGEVTMVTANDIPVRLVGTGKV